MRPKKLPFDIFHDGIMILGLWKCDRDPDHRRRFPKLTDAFIDAYGYHPSVVATIWNNIEVTLPGATLKDLFMTLYSFRHSANITTLRVAFNIQGDNQMAQAKIDAFTRGFDEFQSTPITFLEDDPMEEWVSRLESK